MLTRTYYLNKSFLVVFCQGEDKMNFFGKTLEILKELGIMQLQMKVHWILIWIYLPILADTINKIMKNKNRFKNALIENDEIALANLLYTLDIRNGKGERALFKSYFSALIEMNKDYAIQILPYIPELGRWLCIWRNRNWNWRKCIWAY